MAIPPSWTRSHGVAAFEHLDERNEALDAWGRFVEALSTPIARRPTSSISGPPWRRNDP
jgi:hypothetical protein